MKSPGPGLWITGPSRSGTSMVAGLFARHGVFFGDTVPGDEHNPHGYYEHPELIRRIDMGTLANWPERFWEVARKEGYEDGKPWALKRGPQAWPWIRLMFPRLIVVCKRPKEQVLASRLRRWPGKKGRHGEMWRQTRRSLAGVVEQAACPVITLHTDQIIEGNYQRLGEAFKAFGMAFDPAIAAAWIDPSIWRRGEK